MALTAVAIKNTKGRAKAYKLADSDGLYLLVTPSGARYRRMNYGHLGKQRTLAFGVWLDTGLAEALHTDKLLRSLAAIFNVGSK